MKLHRFIFAALVCAGFVFSFSSCHSNKEKVEEPEDQMTDYEKNITSQDSAAVVHLVNLFFEYLEKGNYLDAANMLYQNSSPDSYAECYPLENEELQEVVTFLKQMPVRSHHIDYIKFHEIYDNEVKCSVTLGKGEPVEGKPEIKTVFFFKPIDYLGRWVLCMLNSNDGEERTVKE